MEWLLSIPAAQLKKARLREGTPLLIVPEWQSMAHSPCPHTATGGCQAASEGWRAGVLELCGIQTALRLLPAHRKARKFHACIPNPTYAPARSLPCGVCLPGRAG